MGELCKRHARRGWFVTCNLAKGVNKKGVTMTTRAVLIATGLFAATMMSAVAHADEKQHQEKFCASLAKFHADFTTLESIGPSSTVADLRAAADRIAADADEVQTAAQKIKSPTAKQFTDSAHQLRKEVRALPPNITRDQAKSRVQDDIQNVKQSAQQLAAESGCPEAAPQPQPQPQPQEPKQER